MNANPAMPPTAVLHAHGLRVRRGGSEVLHGVTLPIYPGWTALVGPNGAGKSTLLRTLAGLETPESGRVEWAPHSRVAALPPAQRLAWMAQQGETTGELTVRETVELGRLPHVGLLGEPGPHDHAAVQAAMEATECATWADRPLQALSGGERQRALLARALATEAPVLLLDEPTTHLDAPHQLALARLCRKWVQSLPGPRAVVSVLHDLPIALRADRIVVLQEGRVVAEGAAHDAGVHQALTEVFDGAIRIRMGADGGPQVEWAA